MVALLGATGPASAAGERPNAILFIVDDVSWNDVGCYGNAAARTPNLDRLAEGGLRFTQAFLTASSCSPSRSSIITGRYPHNNGRASELHRPIAANLPWFPRLLREAGYYTALSGKNHMTPDQPEPGGTPQPPAFDHTDPGMAPDNKGGHANWVKVLQERPRDKPFFCWFASTDAHRPWDADADWKEEIYGPKHRPEAVVVPPFLRDDAATRQDLASYYNEVTRFDYFVGRVVDELKSEGQLENTLLFLLADNGRPFPRAKTRLEDSGMKTFLVAHWPKGIISPGSSPGGLVSAIDLAPTFLAAAGLAAPDTMQGVSLLPILRHPEATVRQLAFSEHNWHDYEAHGRSVRSGNFLYVRNQRPLLASQGPADSVRSPSHQSLLAGRAAGTLTEAQADVLLAPRPGEELYDTAADPLQLHNLAKAPEQASTKAKLSALLDDWITATGDSAPEHLSKDSFDRETGNSLKLKENEYRGTPPGWDHRSWEINAPGPR